MSVEQATAWLGLLSLGMAVTTGVLGLAYRYVVRPIRQVADRLDRLEHEVAPNGDGDGRSLRAIVRTSERETLAIKESLRRGGERFRRLEDHVGLPHPEGER